MATQSLSEPYHEAQRLHPTQGGLWLDYEKRTGRRTLLDWDTPCSGIGHY